MIGLTTALKLQEMGYKVTIIAECRPGDEKSARYTSPWAVRSISSALTLNRTVIYSTQGAHHVSLAGNDLRQQSIFSTIFEGR